MTSNLPAGKTRATLRRTLKEQLDDVTDLPSRVPHVVFPKR